MSNENKVAFTMRWAFLALSVLCAAVGTGLLLGGSKSSPGVNAAFRALFTTATVPVSYIALQFVLHWALTTIQYVFMPTTLFSFTDIALSSALLVSLIATLPIHGALFGADLFCSGDRMPACQGDTVAQVDTVTRRILVCMIIAASADTAKSFIARFVYATVYGAKQYAKIHKVMQQEQVIRKVLQYGQLTKCMTPLTLTPRTTMEGTGNSGSGSGGGGAAPVSQSTYDTSTTSVFRDSYFNHRAFMPKLHNRKHELRGEVLRATRHMLIQQHLLRGKGKQAKLQNKIHAAHIAAELKRVLVDDEGLVTAPTLRRVLDLPTIAEAQDVMELLDTNNDGVLTYMDLERVVDTIFWQRASLAATLLDMEKVTSTLEGAVAVILHTLLIPAHLAVWKVDIWQFATTLGAILLASAFVFGDTLKQAFEGVVFLFVDCHYQVGDILHLGPDGGLCRVKSMTLTYTELQNESGERMRVRTAELARSAVRNWSRIPSYTESVLVDVDASSFSTERVAGVLHELRGHARASLTDVSLASISSETVTLVAPLKVRLEFKWTYSFCPEDVPRYQNAKSSMLAALSTALSRQGFSSQYTVTYKAAAATDGGSAVLLPKGDASAAELLPPFLRPHSHNSSEQKQVRFQTPVDAEPRSPRQAAAAASHLLRQHTTGQRPAPAPYKSRSRVWHQISMMTIPASEASLEDGGKGEAHAVQPLAGDGSVNLGSSSAFARQPTAQQQPQLQSPKDGTPPSPFVRQTTSSSGNNAVELHGILKKQNV